MNGGRRADGGASLWLRLRELASRSVVSGSPALGSHRVMLGSVYSQTRAVVVVPRSPADEFRKPRGVNTWSRLQDT